MKTVRAAIFLLALGLSAPAEAQGVTSTTHAHGQTGVGRPEGAISLQLQELKRLGQLEPALDYYSDPAVRRLTNYIGFFDALLGNNETSLCTAVLIAADKILTNAHCVAPPAVRPVQAVSVWFTLGYLSSSTDEYERQFRVRPRPIEMGEVFGLDYAVLELEDPVPDFVPHGFDARDPMPGERLVVLGHPDKASLHVTRGGCRVHSTAIHPDETRMNHTCDTLGGNSGSLIFTPDLSTVVGLHNAAGDAGVNHGIRIELLVEKSPTLRAAFRIEPESSTEPTPPDCSMIAAPEGFRCVKSPNGELEFEPAQLSARSPFGIATENWLEGEPGAPLSSFRECEDCAEMVVLPGGTYTMGSPEDEKGRYPDEGPQREVTLSSFALARTEVSFAEWRACVDDGACRPSEDGHDAALNQADKPVVGVSWDDAGDFMGWMNDRVEGSPYRMPSEAEWEYAARATRMSGVPGPVVHRAAGVTVQASSTAYPWGEAFDRNRVNSAGVGGRDRWEKTAPVSSFEANGFGLHDMHGNAREWVRDCSASYSYDDIPDDGGPFDPPTCDKRVLRGGSWGQNPRSLRSANRAWGGPSGSLPDTGLRLARTLNP